MKRILITGAAGNVARMIRPHLRGHYRLRLSDRRPLVDVVEGEEAVAADLGDLAGVRHAVRGTDGIIHLGGYPGESDFETILQSNIVGAYNLFEGARLEGVKRVVFASTNHVVGFYPRSETIPVNVTPRPDTRYGLSKSFGESLASLYADKYGAEVMSIRIGHILPRPDDARCLAIWISPRDLAQLMRIGLESPGIRHEIVYGMSDNKRAWWDNSNAFRLGYRPEDRSEDYAGDILAQGKGDRGDPRVELNQGGVFCVLEG